MNPKFKAALDAAAEKQRRILEMQARHGNPKAKEQLAQLDRKKKEPTNV